MPDLYRNLTRLIDLDQIATDVLAEYSSGAGVTIDGALIKDAGINAILPCRQHSVYCIGDSLTADGTYPARVATLLGASWVVRNAGVGGNTVGAVYGRLSADVLLMGDALYVVVLAGLNDILSDTAAATIEATLQAIYTAVHDAGLTVVAVTCTPMKTHSGWSSGRQAILDAVNAWILNTATDVDYRVDAYSALEDPGAADTLLAIYDSGDHLHLSTAGYELLGTTVYNAGTWTAGAALAALSVTGTAASINQDVSSGASPVFEHPDLRGLTIYPRQNGASVFQVKDVYGANVLNVDTLTDHITIDSQVSVGAMLRSVGISVPVSGKGAEIFLYGDVAYFQGYDRTGGGAYLGTHVGNNSTGCVHLAATGLVGIRTSAPIAGFNVFTDSAGLGSSIGPSEWANTWSVFGAATTTSGPGLGLGYHVTNGAYIVSCSPGATWNPLNIVGGSIKLFAASATEAGRFDAAGYFLLNVPLVLPEASAPTGVGNQAYVYCKDNGSGKTQLCCKLGDNTEIVLATQA
jgi:lysophospholipase L1-like esterase